MLDLLYHKLTPLLRLLQMVVYSSCKAHFYTDEMRHFTSKIIVLDILQNVVIYLFKYFVLDIMIILRNVAFQYYTTSQFPCVA